MKNNGEAHLFLQALLERHLELHFIFFERHLHFYLFIFTFHGSLGRKPLIDIVNIDVNTTQDVYTYEYKHGYEKNKSM